MKRLVNYFITRNTKQVFQWYLIFIFFFGYIYWGFSIPFSKDDNEVALSLPHSIYFSVVTITTLGYGDISPSNLWGMLLTGIEVILGIITLGLFLNSISMEILNKNYEAQKKMAISLLYLPNYSTISSYLRIISALVVNFADLKHPNRQGDKLNEEEVKIFKLSLEEHLGIIPIEYTKIALEKKTEVTVILEKIYEVSDPTINTQLQLDISNLSKHTPHHITEKFMLSLNEHKKDIITQGEEINIGIFSGILQDIEIWLKEELHLITNIQDKLDEFTNIKK